MANGPAWHDRFAGLENKNADPDSFVPKDQMAQYLVDYADLVKAPIREGVEVLEATRLSGKGGFLVETTQGEIEATRIVAATRAFQHPVIPPIVPETAKVNQIHSFHYKNPSQLPDGAVMVVDAGSTGTQIADELNLAGRKVFLSVAPRGRSPRCYRGRDNVWWLGGCLDWPVSPLSPLYAIHCALTRTPWDTDAPDQSITLDECLVAYTSGGAYADFTENHRGALDVGFAADLVLIDGDLDGLATDSAAATIALTLCDGRITHSDINGNL